MFRTQEPSFVNVEQIKAQNKQTKRNKNTEKKTEPQKPNTIHSISYVISIILYMYISMEGSLQQS